MNLIPPKFEFRFKSNFPMQSDHMNKILYFILNDIFNIILEIFFLNLILFDLFLFLFLFLSLFFLFLQLL